MVLKYTLAFATALLVAAPMLTTTSHAAAVVVSGAELKKLLAGKTARFPRGSRATYNADGTYKFRGRGRTERGVWKVSGSRVCVTFNVTNFRRCDRYLKDGNQIYFRDANGNQFPVRIK